jgi:hypothetical protein
MVAELNQMSEELKDQPGLAAYLERGRFGAGAREALKKEYVSRYVLLRGGGPIDQQPGSAPLLSKDLDLFTELTDRSIRNGFVRKVYSILCAQLLLTTLLGWIVMNWIDDVPKAWVGTCFLMSLALLIAAICAADCNPALMRTFPMNYWILLVFTVAQSVLVGIIGARFTDESVLVVSFVTAIVVCGLSVVASQTSYDFTGWGPYLLCGLFIMIGLSLALFIAVLIGLASSPAFHWIRLILAGFGVMLFGFFIIYDTQLIIGGKHKNKIKIDDYCMAALNLYIDIIQMFTHLLEIFGDRK